MSALVVEPLTPERWSDLESIFLARGCSVARTCWCLYYRDGGAAAAMAPGERRSEHRRREMRAWSASDMPAGLIGYEEGRPVGWVSLGPRSSYRKLEKSRVMKVVDAQPVWSIVCFVVPAEHRRRGVAARLLAGAAEFARQRGVQLLEAYPVDRAADPDAESLWFGTLSMYDAAGFQEVARRKPARPVVRLHLEPAGHPRRDDAAWLRLAPASHGDLVVMAEGGVPASVAGRLEDGALPPPFVAARALEQRQRGASWDWCGMFYVLDAATARVLGSCGFKHEPHDGLVEIGYGIAPAARGAGRATAAVRQLLALAGSMAPGVTVLAQVNAQNLASTGVVRRLGFEPHGELVDTDGELLVQWLHRPPALARSLPQR